MSGPEDVPTPTEDVAYRADIYRAAVALVQSAGLIRSAEPDDVLGVARFLAGYDI